MNEPLLRLYAWHVNARPALLTNDERGEGVISMAIAVLIMAFIGVAVWGGFKLTVDNTQKKVDAQVEQIGQ